MKASFLLERFFKSILLLLIIIDNIWSGLVDDFVQFKRYIVFNFREW